jgi:6-phospho-3-hexuloisomerase
LKQELPIIGEVVDEYIPSVQFKSLVDKMENRCNITVGGKGPSRYVADMTAIRLQHVKRVSGSDAYVAGPFAHPPWPGDIGIFISWSGETKPTLSWCDKYRRSGGYIFSITGNRKNRLSEKSDDSFVISSESPSFYERTAFALSPVPLHLLEIFERRGFNIPEYLLEWYHSIT